MTSEYVEIINTLRAFALKNYTPISQKKIYYFHGRSQSGEERVAEYVKSKGYSVVRPETLSLEEQLNLLANCESFISSLGSISHNSMFLTDNTRAVFIPRTAGKLNEYQHLINGINNINVTYLDSTLTVFKSSSNGPFFYIISKQLKKFFGDKADDYTDEDFVAFLQYFKMAMAQGLNLNLEATDYYDDVWRDFIMQLSQRKDLQAKVGIMIK